MNRLHIIMPALGWTPGIEDSLKSLGQVPSARLGQVLIVAPGRQLEDITRELDRRTFLVTRPRLVEETGKGVYPAYNNGLDALSGESGYVIFLGAGDCLHTPATELCKAMDSGTPLICIPVDGDPATLRRFPARSWGLLTCLPNSQGCIFNLNLGEYLRYDEKFAIHDDVLQRLDIMRHARCLHIDCPPLVTIEPAGVSGVQSFRKIVQHSVERVRLFGPILLHGEPLLAVKYLAGIARVVARYLKNIERVSA
jgi:hypothetical protein